MTKQPEDMTDAELSSRILQLCDQLTDEQAARAVVELEIVLGPLPIRPDDEVEQDNGQYAAAANN